MLVALTVSLLIVTAPRAQALVKRTAESEVQTGQWFSVAVVRCRADERVVSGGYRLDPDSGNSPAASRAKGRRAWTVTAFESDFIAYALCTHRYKPAKVAETVAFGDSSHATAVTATCERGERAISGGFQFSELALRGPVYSSRPTGKQGWSIVAYSDNADLDLKGWAYCVPDQGGITIRRASRRVPPVASRTVVAKCRSNEARLSGGWTVRPRPDPINTAGPNPYFSEAYPRAQRAFLVTATNYSNMAGRISAITVCAK